MKTVLPALTDRSTDSLSAFSASTVDLQQQGIVEHLSRGKSPEWAGKRCPRTVTGWRNALLMMLLMQSQRDFVACADSLKGMDTLKRRLLQQSGEEAMAGGMMNSVHDENRATLTRLRQAMYDFELDAVRRTIDALFEPEARIRLAFPFYQLEGPEDWFNEALAPLAAAWPDIKRRDVLVISGDTEHGDNWVGCAGTYSGIFLAPWLDIPPTGHVVAMRFHEFYRIVDSRIVELQALWDIPEVMMQARAWPLAPSLGREWQVPGPATQDGIVRGPRFEDLNFEKDFRALKVYSHSKLAKILFTRELAKRLKGSGVTANAVDPGEVATGLGSQNGWMGKSLQLLMKPFLKSPEKGARTSIYASVSPELEGVTGQYYRNRSVQEPKPWAMVDAAAERLWEMSARLTNLPTPPAHLASGPTADLFRIGGPTLATVPAAI